MHQGLRLGRPWLGLILVACCLPLFIGLGRADLETDEAIYSFAVDRILEIGDWLAPKSSPVEDAVFLEKPPLKFWLVAAPIKAGLLPHNEFGLRFLDAVAGSAAFVYVFAIGTLLAGPVCGAVAVLLLFIHIPLLHQHGLRTNNMEAALLLSYCAGMFHFLRWTQIDEPGRRTRHLYPLALFFVLGFGVKFVAALFLPFTLGLVTLASPRCRERLRDDWRTWAAAAMLVVGLCAPWFVYAHLRFGSQLWQTILGEHVVKRLTNYLDPTHLQPWYYYLQTMWREFVHDQVAWLIGAGIVALVVQAVRRRWLAGMVVVLWGAVPLAIISAGTSKVYHYAYPFLPPFALAAGYLCTLIVLLAPAPIRRSLEAAEDRVIAWVPPLGRWQARPAVRQVASVLFALAAVLAIGAVLFGQVRLAWDGRTIFRSSGVWRPILFIVLTAVATRGGARVHRLIVALAVLSLMPMPAYRGQMERLQTEGRHPIRDAAACLARVQAQTGVPAGMFVDLPLGVWHPLYYYFRRVQPWTYASEPLDPAIGPYLSDPAAARPVLIAEPLWRQWAQVHGRGAGDVAPPMLRFLESLLLLPGPYGACSPESRLRSPG